MPRTLSETALSALHAEQTGTPFLVLAILEHDDLNSPLRFVDNGEDIMHDGDLYTAVGFEFRGPRESDQGFGMAEMVMANVDQWLTPTIRSLSGSVTVTVKIVTADSAGLAADPPEFEYAEQEFQPFEVKQITLDETQVRAELAYNSALNRKFPADTFNAWDFPGLF